VKPFTITGVGLVSPLGIGFDAFARGLAAYAERPSDLFRDHPTLLDPNKTPEPSAAECQGFEARDYLGDKGLRNFDRLTKMLIVAAKLTLDAAGLRPEKEKASPLAPDRVGLCSATAYGSLEAITEAVSITELEDPRFLNPNRFPNTVINASAGYVSIWEDLRAPNVTVVNGNCGSLDAVLSGQTHLQNGRADAFLVGGGEALSDALYTAFRKLDVVADRGRYFAPGRSDSQGMLLGEGAAYFCLEEQTNARARGALELAEVIGFGNTFEPPESEAVLVRGSSKAVARAIRMALDDAGLEASEIDLVASAVSGIVAFDVAELAGIRAVLGPDCAIAMPKAIFGETFGAGGALAMACAVAWLSGVPIAPLLTKPLTAAPRHVLVVAVGYYGNASALIMRAPTPALSA
jgi:3-oxoacyl-[acyl-carrier-protein] synthase II